jgi:hypothetical protein
MVVSVTSKLDALLDLLAATADSLAATWYVQHEGAGEDDFAGDDLGQTIQ